MKKFYSLSVPRGFTLIELLITVAISLVVVAASIAAFATFGDRQKGLVAAKDLQQLLRSAQTKARVRDTPTAQACGTLTGYTVAINTGFAELSANCTTAPLSRVTQRINFSDATVTAGTGTYVFSTLESTVTLPGGSVSETIEVEPSGVTAGSTVFSFTINTTGAISVVESGRVSY